MPRVTRVLAGAVVDHEKVVDTVVLALERRRVQRGRLVGVKGTPIEVDLAAPVTLRMGDALVFGDGGLVEVVAEAEPLLEARAKDLDGLARLAWNLGDRHVPIEVLANRLRVRRGPTIEMLLVDLGARVAAIEAPFDPEGGAYTSAQGDHPGHGHDDHHHHGGDDDHGR